MDGYAFSSCDLARLAEVDGLRSDADDDTALPSEERIRQSIIQLESVDPDEVAAAAEFLFERAHTSHMRSVENKEQMRRERLAREQQYREAREEQLRLTRQRDVEVYGELRKEYLAKLDQERGRLEELNRQRDAARFQKHYHLCRAIVDQVVDLTAKTCEYRAVTQGQLVPSKQWREWLVTFSAGLPLYPEQPPEDQPPHETALPPEEEKIAVLLDEREYDAYLDQEEEWAAPEPPPTEAEAAAEEEAPAADADAQAADAAAGVPEPQKQVTGNGVLGAAIKLLRQTVEEPVEPPKAPPAEEVPRPELRLAVSGAPLAGVSRQADKLAEQYELSVIRVQAVLAEAIKDFESTMQEYEDRKSVV